jgi:ProP effector
MIEGSGRRVAGLLFALFDRDFMTSNVPESPANDAPVAATTEASAGAPAVNSDTQEAASEGAATERQEGNRPSQNRGQRGGQRNRQGGQGGQGNPNNAGGRGAAPARQHPVLDQLALLYPALFGETLLPLKRGVFQDLLAAQPEALDKDGLKAALALHTRSTRYLTAVASGQQRHDLAGLPVEPLAPEHVHHALIEVFRRRGARSREDLRPKMRQRIAIAFEASGLSRDAYLELVSGKDEEVNQITKDGVEEAATRLAKDEALLRTFEASGKNLNEFADMYGLHVLDANRTLERAKVRRDQTAALAEAAAVAAAAEPAAEPQAPEA